MANQNSTYPLNDTDDPSNPSKVRWTYQCISSTDRRLWDKHNVRSTLSRMRDVQVMANFEQSVFPVN